MTLASGHFTVDMYSGLLPVLYPILTDRFELDLKTVGLVALAYSGASSVSQPFFGWLADRYGTRFTALALAWSAVLFATIGFAPSFEILLVLATLAGLGSGAFHPFGAITASSVIGEKSRNTAMSIYSTGGTLGVAIGPMIGAVLFHVFGMRGTAVMLIPGVTIAIWLLFAMRSVSVTGTRSKSYVRPTVQRSIPYLAVGIIIAVMMLRMFPTIGLQNFIPLWYDDMGYGASYYGPLATVIVLSSAFGALGAGTLADKYGRRVVMLVTTILSIPAVWAFAEFPGHGAFVSGAAIGLLSGSTSPLMLVMAQQLMVGRAGVASGFILGLGFVAGAIGTPIFGAIGDAFGMQNAVRSQIIVLLFACVAAWFLPTEKRMAEIQEEQTVPVSEPATAD
ncbi:MAG TPA: MFS transporter [Thermomicrobiales bacterium]|nr:MFS transporter [Thermomicrobiales bacterium]